MEETLKNQQKRADKINQLYTNYKKDAALRKTKRYLEEKIASLKQIYNEYVDNDEIIRSYDLDQSHPYLTDRKDTMEMYNTFIADMRIRLNGAPLTPTITPEGQSGPSFTLLTDDKSTKPIFSSLSNLQQMLKQQDFRIRALYREIVAAEEILENNKSRPALMLKYKKMEKMMTQITDLNERICMDATDQDEANSKYFIENHYESINNRYDDIAILITTETEEGNKMEIKLKPIEIPQFHGDYTKWVGFADTFITLVHKNKQLTKTHKMNYLKTHVVGLAGKLLSHLETTGDNYEAAWEILENRFNNKRLLVSTLLNTMLNQPSCHAESANAIKQLHDTTTECLHAIRNLGIDINSWSPFVVLVISKKLDYESRRLYESSIDNPREIQSTSQFLKFLERRFQSLETTGANRTIQVQQPLKRAFLTTTKPENPSIICVCCQKYHRIDTCLRFKGLSNSERNQMVMLHNLCRVCLAQDHPTTKCHSHTNCTSCKGGHHTLLHQEKGMSSKIKLNITSESNNESNPVLLATALVKVRNNHGGFNLLRALIDTGSQATFITEEAAQQLGLPKTKVIADVSGISASKGKSHHQITIDIHPRFPSQFKTQTQALVLKTITKPLPDKTVMGLSNEIQDEKLLADPTFDRPGPIDMLIGADIYGGIILEGIKRDPRQKCIAQNTEIGWIISGSLSHNNKIPVKKLHSLITIADIDKQLKQFWESEELHPKRSLTAEEQKCEEYYEKTHKRLKNGRYEVRIPLNYNQLREEGIGESKAKAAARLLQIEKRFKKDEEYKNQYHNFMNEYIQLDHMELIKDDSATDASMVYYMPHHSVIKEDSTTTKLRVVFDASCNTTTGTSLNKMMLVGPTLQDNLTAILIRWKKHRYVITSDIEKMFRQINVASEDQDFQRILWRSDPEKPMRSYRLKTVTYGTASATYLATKTLQQLAIDEAPRYPIGSRIVQNDFYVDDLLSGANTITEAIAAQKELLQLLSGGGFNLRKWNSNEKAILEELPENQKETGLHTIEFNDTVKTLGLLWNSSTDKFQFKVSLPNINSAISKRTILSEASKLYDPLGWLAPVVVQAKILLQDLWASGIGWDDKLNLNFENRWLNYKLELPQLEKIRIHRWINYTSGAKIELHGFCDASTQAYAAVVYSKVNSEITIIAAKTKVAPLAQTISLPRLELNAALLLSKLVTNVIQALEINNNLSTFFWSDSTAVLGWIKGKPQNHKTFVANRISEIQSSTNPSQWYHVVSNENPADCASRGLNPVQLLNHRIWWEGPQWLKGPTYPTTNIDSQEMEEAGSMERKSIRTFAATVKKPIIEFERFSSLSRLIRSIAYCLRFSSNTKFKTKNISQLTTQELNISLRAIIKVVQQEAFETELKKLKSNQNLPNGSTIITLTPFIDGNDLLRVGGRITNSHLSFEEKHPIIMPRGHNLSRILIREAHIKTLHGGNQATLAYLRTQYWIINAKDMIRHIIHKCIICSRARKSASRQLMGMLPKERVTPAPPFTNSGVDYAGPISIKLWKGRCNKTTKGYIAIFICLATKAIHLELVSDLSTEAFLAAYQRFISRRGICLRIFSDCGTNFVGANKQLQRQAKQQEAAIMSKTAQMGTEWHFVPPGSPHFGGLWEAGVKSTKQHLRKVIGTHTLTFEELSTLLAQIEACLNSRPLAPLSNDPDDEGFLSPAHFLIGRAIISTPQPDIEGIKTVTRWNLLTKLSQGFWKKWHTDYLSRLQRRPKWLLEQPNLQVGELVILKDEQLPPTHWSLARVVELHPGQDGLVRVVTLKYKNSTLKRNITKVCRLPVTNESSNEKSDPLHSVIVKRRNSKEQLLNTTTPQHKPIVQQDNGSLSTIKTRSKSKPGVITTTSRIMSCLTLLMVIGNLGAEAKNDFQVTFWNNTPGIYFEEIGALQLLASRWKLIVHYDLDSYWKEIANILNYIHNLNVTCQGIRHQEDKQTICEVIYKQLYRQMTTINQQNKLIQKFNKNLHRNKRGVGDTVGFVLGDMFGILTQREAEHYEKAIMQTKSNEEHLLNLIKNQTSIIDSTINVVKHDHDTSTKHFNLLQENIQILSNTSNQLIRDNLRHNEMQSILIYVMQIMLVMKDLQDTQNAIVDVLTHSQHGKVHPLLITPKQMEEELRKILERIPSGNQLPGGNNLNNMADIYRIMRVKYRVTNNQIVFLIQLPIPQVEAFQIFNQLAVPTFNKNISQCIKPSTRYLAINRQRERYTPMSQQDLNECIFVKEEQYICDISPIYNKQSSVSACELNFLQHNTNVHSSCKIETENPANTWIKTWRANHWIFSLIEETKFDLICNKETEMIRLNGAGVFSFTSNCALRGNSFVITAVTHNANEIKTSYLPAFNLTTMNSESNITKLQLDIAEEQRETSVLADLKYRIALQQENEVLPTEMNYHDVHHYAISYSTIGILIIIFVIVYFRLKKHSQSRMPAPLSRPNMESEA